MSAFQFVCSLGRLGALIAVCGLAFLSAEIQTCAGADHERHRTEQRNQRRE
jgi:hypothetical protein